MLGPLNFFDWPIEKAMEYPDCFRIVKEKVKPERDQLKDNTDGRRRKQFWWQYGRVQREIVEVMSGLDRVMASTRVTKYLCVSTLPTNCVFSVDLAVHCGVTPTAFSVLSSSIFDLWSRETSSTLETRLRFSISDSFESYPFPLHINSIRTGEDYESHRKVVMSTRREGLTKTYNRFHNPEEASADIQKLRELHVEMDSAVVTAYGWTDISLGHGFHETKQGVRFTISEVARREVLARLLRLNHERYADEVKKGLHEPKKKPKASKPKATATKPKVEPTLFDLDTAFPTTEREKVLCGLFCDLVAAEPGLRFDAYSDALMIAVRPNLYEGLLPKEERKTFTALLGAWKLADKKANLTLPWNDLTATLLGNDSIREEAGTAYVLGSRFEEVRSDYPPLDSGVVALIRKVAATLREYQDLDQSAPAEGQKVVAKHSEAKRAQSGTTA